MADPSSIANMGVDPFTGSYLSKERRIAIFRSRNIQSTQAGFGGGANTPAPQTTSIPQTSAIVVRQNNVIAELQKEIGTLKKSQTDSIATYQKELGTIQSSLQTIAVNVTDLGSSLKQNNTLILADTELEKKQQLQEKLQEFQLAEEGARLGKESQLEQKLQNAILSPIRAITAKAQSIFAILQDTLFKFLLGWLTINVLDMFRAESKNNENLVKQIFDTIVSSITAVFKGLQVVNKSLRGIIGIVVGVTKTLAKFMVSGLGLLFKGLGTIVNGIVNAGKSVASGAGKIIGKITGTQAAETAATATARTAGTEVAQAAGKQIAKEGGETAGKSLLKKVPGVSLLAGIGFGAERLYAGDPFGAGLELASGVAGTFAGPGTAISLGIDAFSLKRRLDQVSEQGEKTKESKQAAFSSPSTSSASSIQPPSETQSQTSPTAAPASAPSPQASSTPTMSMMPVSTELSFDSSKMNNVSGEMDFSKTAQYGEIVFPVENGSKQSSQAPSITPAQTQSIPSAPAKVGPEPEPKPNVVMMSSVPGAQGSPDTVLSSKPGGASDVPSIDSSNPDNFYALYAQINYNVLM